jgi:hypothetical protein
MLRVDVVNPVFFMTIAYNRTLSSNFSMESPLPPLAASVAEGKTLI